MKFKKRIKAWRKWAKKRGLKGVKVIDLKAATLSIDNMSGFIWPTPRNFFEVERALKAKKDADKREEYIKHLLSLPFDEAFPQLRVMIANDYRLVFREDMMKWCAKHAKAIADHAKAK